MAKLSDAEIVALVDDYENNSYGLNDAQLAFERAEALDYFYGRPFGNEVEGRSQVVSHDAKDTVLWVLPSMMKVFTAGDEVVRFDPKAQGDEQAADQETAYVNHIVMEKNRGFEILYAWFFDALVSKTGYVKGYWEKCKDTKRETYIGLSDEEIALMLQDDEVKPVAHSEYTDEVGNVYHDIVVEVEDEFGHFRIENVAPENMMVSYSVMGSSLRDAEFVEQRTLMTISELREMGFDVEDNIAAETENRYEQEVYSRDNYGEFNTFEDKGPTRRVLVREVYMRVDQDGDGISELWRYIIVGTTVLDAQEWETIPYASICPVPMPHRHVGLSFVDLVKDLQLIKSTLMRNALDAQYQSIHGRFAVSDRVNLDDMLVSRPGGIVRVDGDPNGAIVPLFNPVDGTKNLGLVEYVDQIRQARTGVTDSFQGIDENALNKTKGGTQMLMSAAQSRIELVARIFAETGVKDLFLLCHEQVRKHANKEEIFRLHKKWVAVDPRTWEKRTDMTVSVGLGTGNKDQMLQHLTLILQAQQQAIQIGVATPKNIYNALVKLTQNAGFKEPEEFWTDPSTQQQQPQKPSDIEVKANADMQMAQMKNAQESQSRMQELAMEERIRQMELSMEAQKQAQTAQNDMLEREHNMRLQAMQHAADQKFNEWKANLDSATKILVAEIAAAAKGGNSPTAAEDKAQQDYIEGQ